MNDERKPLVIFTFCCLNDELVLIPTELLLRRAERLPLYLELLDTQIVPTEKEKELIQR